MSGESTGDSEPEGFRACLKSPWKKITKGLKEINACNNCNIAINSNNVADSSNNSVNNRPCKTEINGKLEDLLKKIKRLKNVSLGTNRSRYQKEYEKTLNAVSII